VKLSHLTFVRKDGTQILVGSPTPRVFSIQPEGILCDVFTASLRLADAFVEDCPQLAQARMYYAGLYRQILNHIDPQRVGPPENLK